MRLFYQLVDDFRRHRLSFLPSATAILPKNSMLPCRSLDRRIIKLLRRPADARREFHDLPQHVLVHLRVVDDAFLADAVTSPPRTAA